MSPESYFNSKAIPLNLANKSLYGVNMILGDGLMVWNELVQIPSCRAKFPDVDLPPLDDLREELACSRPSDPSDNGDRLYVSFQLPKRLLSKFNQNLRAQKALTAVTIWEFSNLTPGQSAFVARVQNIAPPLFAVPLVTNIVITALIIWRIKQAQDTTKFTSNHRLYAFYRRLIRNTIESCVLYPFFLLVTLILYCLHDNGQDIVSARSG